MNFKTTNGVLQWYWKVTTVGLNDYRLLKIVITINLESVFAVTIYLVSVFGCSNLAPNNKNGGLIVGIAIYIFIILSMHCMRTSATINM